MPFSKLLPSGQKQADNHIQALAADLASITSSRANNDSSIGKMAIATESISDDSRTQLTNIASNMKTSLETIVENFQASNKSNIAIEAHQIEAATVAGILGSNPTAFIGSKLKDIPGAASVISPSVAGASMELSLEAYDERANKNAQMYSIMYNLLASRQDDFGECFFPTIVINPTEVGAVFNVKLYYVYNDFKRSVTGALADYGRMNIIRAYANHELLQNEQTKCIPVYRKTGQADDNSAVFLDKHVFNVEVGGGITVKTAYLKTDTKVDLLGLSQTNELLNSGLMGPSDNLDAAIKLKSVLLSVGDDTIVVPTSNVPGSTFHFSVQGNTRRMAIDLDSDDIVLSKDSPVAIGGETLGTSADLQTVTELGTFSARVHLSVAGNIVLDTGATNIGRGSVSLVTLRNASGEIATEAEFAAVAAKLEGAFVSGFIVDAYRANSNLRQRGLLVETQSENRVVQVPYRSPFAHLAPVLNVSGVEDTTALQSLISTVGIYTSNEAVTSLLRVVNDMKAYIPLANRNGELPAANDLGFTYTKPVFMTEEINLAETVDSLNSSDRPRDIRAALVEKVRYYANEMYRQSEYKAAANVLTGNLGYKPTVIVGTDPVIANYLQYEGELRTLGEEFDVKVVSTTDLRFVGKMVISFGVFDGGRNTTINPLNFGNMLFGNTIPVQMKVSRDGQTSDELVVFPRFLHLHCLSIATLLEISGLPTVINKVPVHSKVL